MKIAEAVEYLGTQKVIHRDQKPSNILIQVENNQLIPLITDFGSVKDSETQGSTKVGTEAYMSPEMMQGEGVTSQADVYGLGLILYEMMTGKTPFDTNNMFKRM